MIRGMDKNFGRIICSLFSLIHKLCPKKREAPIKKVLIMELFEMGAGVMAYPAVRHLQKSLPSAEIYCLCTDTVRQSWEVLNVIPRERIIAIKSKSLVQFGVSLLKTIIFLRKQKIDLLIDFELFMRIPSIIAFMSGAKRKAGFHRYEYEGLYRGDYYDYRVAFNQNAHISKNFLALVRTALENRSDYPNYKSEINLMEQEFPVYQSNPSVNNVVKEKIKALYPGYERQPLILVTPDVGHNLSVRNYPKEYYATVIKSLLQERPEHLVLLTGVKENEPICSWITKEVGNSRCINFCSKTASLQELFELIILSTLIIGNDNGPLHFASMTPCKILGLFSTDSPFIYGPLGKCVILYQFYHCSPCISAYNHKRSGCRENRCLQNIDPAQVSKFALEMLDDKLQYRTINNQIPYLF